MRPARSSAESDHVANKSLYGKDPDGLEFEVMWLAPVEHWGEAVDTAIIQPLDIDAEIERFAALAPTTNHQPNSTTPGVP